MSNRPKITAIADGSALTVLVAKQHLRVDGILEDFLIGLYLSAAWNRADSYCNNPFLDYKGHPTDIPADVEIWCLQFVSNLYENRTAGVDKEQVQDLGSVSYARLSDVDVNFNLLKPYRIEPGFSSFVW